MIEQTPLVVKAWQYQEPDGQVLIDNIICSTTLDVMKNEHLQKRELLVSLPAALC